MDINRVCVFKMGLDLVGWNEKLRLGFPNAFSSSAASVMGFPVGRF